MDGISRAPAPELRAFLGSIQYYGKFVPQLSTLLSPLYELLHKNSQWKWTDKCEAAFLAAKAEISSDKILTHYDVKLPIVLVCDASQYGVGAVVSHLIEEEEKPIAFSSRTLTKSEQNYSQLQKEALHVAIIFGIRKFHKYLYGRKFVLLTDHKSLLTILGPKTVPTLSAARLQRWALQLAAHQYVIRFRKTTEHGNAGMLSRLQAPSTDNNLEPDVFLVSYQDDLPVTAKGVAAATKKDIILSKALG